MSLGWRRGSRRFITSSRISLGEWGRSPLPITFSYRTYFSKQLVDYINKQTIDLHPLYVRPRHRAYVVVKTPNTRLTMHNPPFTHILVRYTKLLLRPEPTLEEIHTRKGNIVEDHIIAIVIPNRKIKHTGKENMITQRPSPFSFTRSRGTPNYKTKRSIYILPDTLSPHRQSARNIPIIVSRFIFLHGGPIMMVRYTSKVIEA